MYPFRQELVGKRFLCVREKNSLRPNSRSSRVSNPLDYPWKVGVIRACTEKDFSHPELKVLVEYDNEDWTTREWLKVHDGNWKIFLVEKTMVWTHRPGSSNLQRPVLWPALTYFALVDKHGLNEEQRPIPVEFVGDHERAFVQSDEVQPYGQDDDGLQSLKRNNTVVLAELHTWQHLQKSQSILMDGPFTLTGFRVQVYRQSCRQWFSAVITAHDLVSRELSVMDDTVLQTHRVNPLLVQVILLANEAELDSLLRGDLVRVLPMRQHRHSQVIITAPLTTTTTTTTTTTKASRSDLLTWQLYAGLTQATGDNDLVKCTRTTYQPPAVANTTTSLSTACTTANSHSSSTTRERRKSSDSRNRSAASRRITRSTSPLATTSHETNQLNTQPPSSTNPLLLGHRTVLHTSNTPVSSKHQGKEHAPSDTHSASLKHASSMSPIRSPVSSTFGQKSPIRQPTPTKNSSPYKSSPVSNANVASPVRSSSFCQLSGASSSCASIATPMSGMPGSGMRSPSRIGCSQQAQSPRMLSYQQHMPHLKLSPNQLYALHLQQQQQHHHHQQQQQQILPREQQEYLAKLRHQHFQSLLHQYQTHYYQLQLMVQQQELIQQMPLTREQQHILAEYYNQLLYQYQYAQVLQQLASISQEEQLSMCHAIEGDIQMLPEQIQRQLKEAQERQKQELHNLMPRLEEEELQTIFNRLHQQSMTTEQMHELYTQLVQQQMQKHSTQAQLREKQEEERQEQKLQQYLRQNQEQLQKFLQFPKSPACSQSQDHKQEATSSSVRQPLDSSPSSSSYTVHHMPTSSVKTSPSSASPEKREQTRPESGPSVGSLASESFKLHSDTSGDEIELGSGTLDNLDSSAFPAVQKLLQHHLRAVEATKREEAAKERKSKGTSEQKRGRKGKKSSEALSNLNRDLSDPEKDAKQVISPSSTPVPDSSTEKPKKTASSAPSDPPQHQRKGRNISAAGHLSKVKVKTPSKNTVSCISRTTDSDCPGLEFQKLSAENDNQIADEVETSPISGSKTSLDEAVSGEETYVPTEKAVLQSSRVSPSIEPGAAPWVPVEAASDQKVPCENDQRATVNEPSSTTDKVPTSSALRVTEQARIEPLSTMLGAKGLDKAAVSRTFEREGPNLSAMRGSEKAGPSRSVQREMPKPSTLRALRKVGVDKHLKEKMPGMSALRGSEKGSGDMDFRRARSSENATVGEVVSKNLACKSAEKVPPKKMHASFKTLKNVSTRGTSWRNAAKHSILRISEKIPPTGSLEKEDSQSEPLTNSENSSRDRSLDQELSKALALSSSEKGGGAFEKDVQETSSLRGSEKPLVSRVSEKEMLHSLAARGPEKSEVNKVSEKEVPNLWASRDSWTVVVGRNSEDEVPNSSASTGSEKGEVNGVSEKDLSNWLALKGSENIQVSRTSQEEVVNHMCPEKVLDSKTSEREFTEGLENVSARDSLVPVSSGSSEGTTSKILNKSLCMGEAMLSTIPFTNPSCGGEDTNLFSAKGFIKTYSKKFGGTKRKSVTEEKNGINDFAVKTSSKKDTNKSLEVVNDTSGGQKNNHSMKPNKKLLQKAETIQSREKAGNMVLPTDKLGRSRRKVKNNHSMFLLKKAKVAEINFEDKNPSENELTPRKISKLDNDDSSPRTEESSNFVVDSVSFVADQSVKDISINNSAMTTDSPAVYFQTFKPITQRFKNKNKEKIRELKAKKKKSSGKEKIQTREKDVLCALKIEPLGKADSLETVVDYVLDEDIPVIKLEEVTKHESITNIEEKTLKRKKREPKPKGAPRKKKGKKSSESDGDAVSSSMELCLQDCVCASLPDLPKCRDCRDVENGATSLEFCRFNMFRRLRKKKNGKFLPAGFQLPEHAGEEDFHPWVVKDKGPVLDKMTSLYILSNVADQFCSVMLEEKKALSWTGNVAIAYKRAVQGVREMCDVCATTIFNLHWVCHRCGFGVCLDCYNLRVKEREEQPSYVGKRVFEFKWIMCGPGICHQPKYLSVAQIIPKTVLLDLGDELHKARETWMIGMECPCKSVDDKKDSGAKPETSADSLSERDVQLPNQGDNANEEPCGNAAMKNASSSSSSRIVISSVDPECSREDIDDVNLMCDRNMLGLDSPAVSEQEWLTEEKRRNLYTKKAGCGLVEAQPRTVGEISSGLSLLMDYNSPDGSPCDSPAKRENKPDVFNFALPLNRSGLCGLDLLALACERKEEEQPTRQNGVEDGEQETTFKAELMEQQEEKECKTVPLPVATAGEVTRAESSDEKRDACSGEPPSAAADTFYAPHSWLCNGRLLRLHNPRSPENLKAFETRWKMGEPVLVSQVDKYLNLDIWTPQSFGEEFGSEISDVVNCRNGVVIEKFRVGDFWLGFESIKDRPLDQNGEPMLLKLKDWPPKDDFSEKLPTRFEDLMNNVPLPEYTRRDGSRNLVSRLPDFFVKPDLGPKMYNAYGSAACPKEGTTNLHLDMSDAVNIMVYVGVPRDQGAGEKERKDAIKAVDEACDESQRVRVRQETARIGALWHIYAAEDANKIRECLREVAKERKMKYSSHHDPIHDQCFYLDHEIRERLLKQYGVEGWAICQCLGDAVFIPAGAPHQVRNLYSCVKVAEDFVSPERIDHCFRMTQEFRYLSEKHTNHEDKLQVKNIIFHAVKDAIHSLKSYEHDQGPESANQQTKQEPRKFEA